MRMSDWSSDVCSSDLIGMRLAARPGTPIRRLVLNDIGPWIPRAALERIAGYLGADPRFSTFEEGEAYLRRIYASFGDLEAAQWRQIGRASCRARVCPYV